MSFKNLQKLAQQFDDKLQQVNPELIVKEHDNLVPISYMAFNNLKNIINEATQLLAIMNTKDDLPQWADELLAIAKNNVSKTLDYVRSEKIKTASKQSCSECNDIHCCMNFENNHSLDHDVNEAKCTGRKHSPVGSPRQRAFCARHCAMKKQRTSPEVAKDPESCINKGLRRWKCRCG